MQPVIEKTALELYKQNPASAIDFLTHYSVNEANNATQNWRKLGEYLLIKYLDGNVKKEKDGKFERSEYGIPVYPDFPGYNEDYYRSIAKETGDRLKVTF